MRMVLTDAQAHSTRLTAYQTLVMHNRVSRTGCRREHGPTHTAGQGDISQGAAASCALASPLAHAPLFSSPAPKE